VPLSVACLIANARASAFAVSAQEIHPLSPPSVRGKLVETDLDCERPARVSSSALIRKRRSGAVGEPTAPGLNDNWTLSARPARQGLRGKKGTPPFAIAALDLSHTEKSAFPFFPLHVFS
jgi:hypothetical protein